MPNLLLVSALATAFGGATLDVDLSEAPRRLVHVRLSLPVRAGHVAFIYPKWIPGEHGPTGPIADVAGPTFRAGGKVLPWKRDPVEMYRFELDAPGGDLEIT